MGSNQSIRESHFQRDTPEGNDEADANEQYISISNKMVERLVEDATLAGRAAAKESTFPRDDYKEKLFMEKLVYLDENHSQKYRLTVDDLKATATRIELRTANMISIEPECADCKQKVIACYDSNLPGLGSEKLRCADAVGAFSRCVKDAAARRLRARTQKEAREHARRERRVAHARVHELRDLAPPQDTAA